MLLTSDYRTSTLPGSGSSSRAPWGDGWACGGLLEKRGRHVYVVDRRGLERLAETNTVPERILIR